MDKAEIVFNKLAGTGAAIGAFLTGGPSGYVGYKRKEEGTSAGKDALIGAGVGAGLGAGVGAVMSNMHGIPAKMMIPATAAGWALGIPMQLGIGRLWGKKKHEKK